MNGRKHPCCNNNIKGIEPGEAIIDKDSLNGKAYLLTYKACYNLKMFGPGFEY